MASRNNNPTIAYVGPFSFPEGGAAARRILGNTLSLRMAGYTVLIGSGQMPTLGISNTKQYQGLEVHSLGERTAEHYPTLIKHSLYFGIGRKTRKWLDTLRPRLKAVILYSGYTPYFMQLLPWCEKNSVPLIFDAVEWYDPPSILGGVVSPYHWNIELAMRHYCVRTKNVIAISSYLEEYYNRRGCNTIKIPPTLDTEEIEPYLETRSKPYITIGYAGFPGRKDLFDNYLEAILRFDPKGRHIRLQVAGITCEQLMTYPAIIKRKYSTIPVCIETLGMATHRDALDLIRQADFSVLLRSHQRYAQAGFPTKIVESMAVGTPVISNITSDLGDHLHDGIEGIICADHQPDSLMAALEKVLGLSVKQRQDMRLASRNQAEKSFDYRMHVGNIENYFAGLLK